MKRRVKYILNQMAQNRLQNVSINCYPRMAPLGHSQRTMADIVCINHRMAPLGHSQRTIVDLVCIKPRMAPLGHFQSAMTDLVCTSRTCIRNGAVVEGMENVHYSTGTLLYNLTASSIMLEPITNNGILNH